MAVAVVAAFESKLNEQKLKHTGIIEGLPKTSYTYKQPFENFIKCKHTAEMLSTLLAYLLKLI